MLYIILYYVGLSRVRSINDLFLDGKLTYEHCVPNNILKDTFQTLRTERKLKLPRYSNYQNGKFTIYYHNITSLNSEKIIDLTTDPLYSNHDLIIISEANVKFPSTNKFFPFKAVYVSENTGTDKKPTILCLCKQDIYIIQTYRKIHNYKVLDLIFLRLNNIYVLTGYASPDFPKWLFKSIVAKMTTIMSNTSQFILIGDFNYNNFNSSNQKFLRSLVPQFPLNTSLKLSQFTTENNTQIDIIYTNITNFNAQTYTTFYSYHLPIYIQIDKQPKKD